MVLHTGRPCPLRQIHLIRMHFAHVCLGDIDLVNCRDLRQAEVCRRFVRRTKDESVQGAWTATLQWSMGVSRKLSQLQDFGGMMQWCNISTWDFCALGHQGFGCRDQYWSQPCLLFFLPCFHAFARKKLVFFQRGTSAVALLRRLPSASLTTVTDSDSSTLDQIAVQISRQQRWAMASC